MDFPDIPFWDFSVALYSKPGVGAACLGLQDRHEIDVNILMFCLWMGAAGYPAATADEALRARIQKLEIDAEHLEQVTLFTCICTEKEKGTPGSKMANALSNVRHYFRELGIETGADDEDALAGIVAQTFPLQRDGDIASGSGDTQV